MSPRPSPKPQPPDRIFVTWCETCGSTITAEPKKHGAFCPKCPVPVMRVRNVRYQLAKRMGSR